MEIVMPVLATVGGAALVALVLAAGYVGALTWVVCKGRYE